MSPGGGLPFILVQVYTGEDFVTVYPSRSKKISGKTLCLLAEDVGAPNKLMFDNLQEQVGPGTDFQKTANYLKIKCDTIKAHTNKQIVGERKIGELRRRTRD